MDRKQTHALLPDLNKKISLRHQVRTRLSKTGSFVRVVNDLNLFFHHRWFVQEKRMKFSIFWVVEIPAHFSIGGCINIAGSIAGAGIATAG